MFFSVDAIKGGLSEYSLLYVQIKKRLKKKIKIETYERQCHPCNSYYKIKYAFSLLPIRLSC